jgi:hypothetical protein
MTIASYDEDGEPSRLTLFGLPARERKAVGFEKVFLYASFVFGCGEQQKRISTTTPQKWRFFFLRRKPRSLVCVASTSRLVLVVVREEEEQERMHSMNRNNGNGYSNPREQQLPRM